VGEYEDEFSSTPQVIKTEGKGEKIFIDPHTEGDTLKNKQNLNS